MTTLTSVRLRAAAKVYRRAVAKTLTATNASGQPVKIQFNRFLLNPLSNVAFTLRVGGIPLQVPANSGMLIGRSWLNHVRISDPLVDLEHIKISTTDNNTYQLVNLSDKPVTVSPVNGRKIELGKYDDRILENGDQVEFALSGGEKIRLAVEFPGSAIISLPPPPLLTAPAPVPLVAADQALTLAVPASVELSSTLRDMNIGTLFAPAKDENEVIQLYCQKHEIFKADYDGGKLIGLSCGALSILSLLTIWAGMLISPLSLLLLAICAPLSLVGIYYFIHASRQGSKLEQLLIRNLEQFKPADCARELAKLPDEMRQAVIGMINNVNPAKAEQIYHALCRQNPAAYNHSPNFINGDKIPAPDVFLSKTYVSVQWGANAASSYRVYFGTTRWGKFEVLYQKLETSWWGKAFHETGRPGQRYFYRMTVFNAEGETDFSPAVSAVFPKP